MSYFGVVDAVRRSSYEAEKAVIQARGAMHARVASPALLPHRPGPETYSREILDVRDESESRALIVVRVKNTTPIPSGMTEDPGDETLRKEGDRYIYVMEKTGSGWMVTEIWAWPLSIREWRKSRPIEGSQVHMPTMTHGGAYAY